MEKSKEEPKMVDKGKVQMISHILIRDPDSGEIILNKRDSNEERKK